METPGRLKSQPPQSGTSPPTLGPARCRRQPADSSSNCPRPEFVACRPTSRNTAIAITQIPLPVRLSPLQQQIDDVAPAERETNDDCQRDLVQRFAPRIRSQHFQPNRRSLNLAERSLDPRVVSMTLEIEEE